MEEAVRKEKQKHAEEIRILEEKLKQNFVMVRDREQAKVPTVKYSIKHIFNT